MMKNLLRMGLAAAITLLGLQGAAAQTYVPNGTFETWANRPTVLSPTSWLTTDDEQAFFDQEPAGTYNFGAVTRVTDVHGGTYAAKLTTTSSPFGGLVAGDVILGTKSSRYTYLGYPIGGLPLAAKPAQMNFFYKFDGTAADSAFALVYMTKTTNGVPALLARGYAFLAPAANYTSNTITFTYSTTNLATPDSVHIIFSSAFANSPTVGTSLFVDDVRLTGGTLATRADLSVQEQVTVSPNPSVGGRFMLNSAAQPVLAAAPLQVLDHLGRVVARRPAEPAPSGQRELDLSALSPGLYLLRLDTQQGVVTRQLSVK